MKTTNRVLLIALGVVAAIILGVLISIRLTVGGTVTFEAIGPEGREVVTADYDFEGFTAVASTGVWQVELQQGADYDVTVHVSRYLRERLAVEQSGNTLRIGLEPGTRMNMAHHTLRAVITMPEVEEMRSEGGAEITMRGFEQERLTLSARGASSVSATECVFEYVELDIDGAGDVDLQDSRTTNADVALDGAGSIRLTMAGGRLTGSINGAGSLTYGGSVAEESIRTSGLASVNRN